MRSKAIVAKVNKPSAAEQPKPRKTIETLPDPIFLMQDIPSNLPPITQRDLTDYLNTEWEYRIMKADFERKRADLVFKLVTNHKVEESSDYAARLDKEGRLVVSEKCSCCGSVNLNPIRY